MPTYEYACSACDARHDIVQSMTEDALTECPSCGESTLRKLFGNVGVVFKGSGFYRNDSRESKKTGSASSSESKGSESTSSSTGSTDSGSSSTTTSSGTDSSPSTSSSSTPAKAAPAKPAASTSTTPA